MKRDLNLMRQIMLDLEEYDIIQRDIAEIYPNKTIEEWTKISYHVKLLAGAGYITLDQPLLGYGFYNYVICDITNQGHDFISMTTNSSIWNKMLPKLEAIGGVITIEIVKALFSKTIGM